MKTRLLNLVPGVRWAPHDLDVETPESATSDKKAKTKPHHRLFSIKSSSSSTTQDHTSSPTLLQSHTPALLRTKFGLSSSSHTPSQSLLSPSPRTRSQSQSPFFTLLPLEIRRMVYEYVFGEETVHFTFSGKKRFAHFLCGEEEKRECGCRVLVGGSRREGKGRLDCGTGTLGGCWRLYTESHPHLYRTHTFSLLHITHLLYLPSALPHSLSQIRHLNLRWAIRALPYLRRGPSSRLAYREDTANWELGWNILAGMEGLRSLFVVLVDPSVQGMWERNWLELEEVLLRPLKKVTRPERFEVVLPFSSCGVDWDMGESRVVLRRPGET